jgi:hypothetical protein
MGGRKPEGANYHTRRQQEGSSGLLEESRKHFERDENLLHVPLIVTSTSVRQQFGFSSVPSIKNQKSLFEKSGKGTNLD